MTTNMRSRPRHCMKVNAYAAKAAIRIGITVAGSATMKLLMNAWDMGMPAVLLVSAFV